MSLYCGLFISILLFTINFLLYLADISLGASLNHGGGPWQQRVFQEIRVLWLKVAAYCPIQKVASPQTWVLMAKKEMWSEEPGNSLIQYYSHSASHR